jgi:hypothetical protein
MTLNTITGVPEKLFLCLLFPVLFWSSGVFHYTVFDRNIHLTWIVLILFLLLWFCAWFARRIVFLLLIANIGVIYFFCGITPEQRFHRTKWQEPWQVKPQAEYLPDGKIRIRNIRDFRYHNEQDYKIRYKDQVLDLNDLKYMELDRLSDSLYNRYSEIVNNNGSKFSSLVGKLEALSPLAVLSRGFSIANKDNRVVTSANELSSGDELVLIFNDGKVDVEVK